MEKTVNTKRYLQQLTDLNRSLLKKAGIPKETTKKSFLFRRNALSYTEKPVRNTSELLSWEVLSCAAYPPDLAASDYHLFALMGHALTEHRLDSYENVRKWLDEWLAAKERGIHKLLERWKKCITSEGVYFE